MPSIVRLHSIHNTSVGPKTAKNIVVHYTAGGYGKGSARANAHYFATTNTQASADYIVDSDEIIETNDRKTSGRYTWHCGGGSPIKGTNYDSIGIEVTMKGDKPYTDGEIKNLEYLVPYLMDRYKIPASRVYMHKQMNSIQKPCPLYYSKRSARWAELKDIITNPPKKKEEPVKAKETIQAAYNGTDAQLWKFVDCEDGYVMIKNKAGKVLDVTGGSTKPMADGRAVYQYTDNGTDAQRWKLVPSEVGGYMICSKLDESYCLDNTGGKVGVRSYVRMHKVQDSARNKFAQSWILAPTINTGWYSVVNLKSFYCLDSNPTMLAL